MEVLDPTGAAVEVGAPTRLGDTRLVLDLGPLAQGPHRVRVRTGDEVVQADLPVALPFLTLHPATLPAGFPVPAPLSATLDDLPLDATTTVAVLDPRAEPPEVPGAAAAPRVRRATPGRTTLDLAVQRPLPEGRYVVRLGTGTAQALAALTVGGRSPAPAAAAAGVPAPGDTGQDRAGEDRAGTPERGTPPGAGPGTDQDGDQDGDGERGARSRTGPPNPPDAPPPPPLPTAAPGRAAVGAPGSTTTPAPTSTATTTAASTPVARS